MADLFAIVGIAKLKTAGNIAGVLAHMTRQRETPNSNGRANDILIPPQNTAEIMEYINSFSPRKNAVLAYDMLLTASPDFFTGKSESDIRAWAETSLQWVAGKFGKENIKAAVIHRDEQTIHISLCVVAEHENKLNARFYTGGREKMRQLWTEYAQAVKQFGLKRGREFSPAEHKSIKQYYADVKRGEELGKGRNFRADELPPPSVGDRIAPAEYAAKLINHVANHYRKQNGNLLSALRATEKELEQIKNRTATERKLLKQIRENPEIIAELKTALATERGKYKKLVTAVKMFFRRNVSKNDSLRKPERLGDLLTVPELQKDLRIGLTPEPKQQQDMERERG